MTRDRGWLGIAAVVAIGLVLSLALGERYHHRILTLVFLWATMGLAWNIISGYAGQISFGHQAFFGIGAYVTVLLAAKLHLTPWLGMLGGAAVAVLAALLIGTPTFRLAGIYFGLATLAYPLIFRILMDFLGYQEVAIPMVRDHPVLFMQFEEPRTFDLLALVLLAATLVLSRLIETSRLGYSLRAIKENEQAAEAMGVDAFRCKMAAYVLSAAPAALAGAIYAHAILFVVTPDGVFGVIAIVQTLTVCLVGGAGTLWGPVIGAAIMIPISEILDATAGDRFPGIQGVVYGATLMAIMMWAPEGLFWRLRRRRAPVARATPVGRRGRGRGGPRRTARARAARGPRDQQGVHRAAGAGRRELRRARGRDPRHHRPERRGEDHALQRAQRLPAARQRRGALARRADHRPAAPPGLPARHRPHLPGGALLPAPHRAGERHGGRLRPRRRAGRRAGAGAGRARPREPRRAGGHRCPPGSPPSSCGSWSWRAAWPRRPGSCCSTSRSPGCRPTASS